MTVGRAKTKTGTEVSCGRDAVDEVRRGTTNMYKYISANRVCRQSVIERKASEGAGCLYAALGSVTYVQCRASHKRWKRNAVNILRSRIV